MPVYFARAGEGGPIKIGYTAGDICRRIAALKTGCPFDIAAVSSLEGGPELEKELHARFRAHRLSGEWFSPVPDLLSVVAAAVPLAWPPRKLRLGKLAGAHLPWGPDKDGQYPLIENSEELRRWRDTMGLRQGEAAEALGVARRTYCRWERPGEVIERQIMLTLACAALLLDLEP